MRRACHGSDLKRFVPLNLSDVLFPGERVVQVRSAEAVLMRTSMGRVLSCGEMVSMLGRSNAIVRRLEGSRDAAWTGDIGPMELVPGYEQTKAIDVDTLDSATTMVLTDDGTIHVMGLVGQLSFVVDPLCADRVRFRLCPLKITGGTFLAPGEKPVRVFTGHSFGMFLTNQGRLWSFGQPERGRLGRLTEELDRVMRTATMPMPPGVAVTFMDLLRPGETIVGVNCFFATLVWTSLGRFFTAGDNTGGQLMRTIDDAAHSFEVLHSRPIRHVPIFIGSAPETGGLWIPGLDRVYVSGQGKHFLSNMPGMATLNAAGQYPLQLVNVPRNSSSQRIHAFASLQRGAMVVLGTGEPRTACMMDESTATIAAACVEAMATKHGGLQLWTTGQQEWSCAPQDTERLYVVPSVPWSAMPVPVGVPGKIVRANEAAEEVVQGGAFRRLDVAMHLNSLVTIPFDGVGVSDASQHQLNISVCHGNSGSPDTLSFATGGISMDYSGRYTPLVPSIQHPPIDQGYRVIDVASTGSELFMVAERQRGVGALYRAFSREIRPNENAQLCRQRASTGLYEWGAISWPWMDDNISMQLDQHPFVVSRVSRSVFAIVLADSIYTCGTETAVLGRPALSEAAGMMLLPVQLQQSGFTNSTTTLSALGTKRNPTHGSEQFTSMNLGDLFWAAVTNEGRVLWCMSTQYGNIFGGLGGAGASQAVQGVVVPETLQSTPQRVVQSTGQEFAVQFVTYLGTLIVATSPSMSLINLNTAPVVDELRLVVEAYIDVLPATVLPSLCRLQYSGTKTIESVGSLCRCVLPAANSTTSTAIPPLCSPHYTWLGRSTPFADQPAGTWPPRDSAQQCRLLNNSRIHTDAGLVGRVLQCSCHNASGLTAPMYYHDSNEAGPSPAGISPDDDVHEAWLPWSAMPDSVAQAMLARSDTVVALVQCAFDTEPFGKGYNPSGIDLTVAVDIGGDFFRRTRPLFSSEVARGTFAECLPGLTGDTCAACPQHFYKPSQASACQRCPPLTQTIAIAATSIGDCVAVWGVNSTTGQCNRGYTALLKDAAANEWLCAPCPPGTYGSLDGSGLCKQCPVGHYSDTEGALECTICQPGRVQSGIGISSADILSALRQTQSPASQPPKLKSASCEECGVTAPRASDDGSQCLGCAPGTHWASLSRSCESCLDGEFCAGDALRPTACPDGYFCLAGRRVECPPGYICPMGASAPADCPANMVCRSPGLSAGAGCAVAMAGYATQVAVETLPHNWLAGSSGSSGSLPSASENLAGANQSCRSVNLTAPEFEVFGFSSLDTQQAIVCVGSRGQFQLTAGWWIDEVTPSHSGLQAQVVGLSWTARPCSVQGACVANDIVLVQVPGLGNDSVPVVCFVPSGHTPSYRGCLAAVLKAHSADASDLHTSTHHQVRQVCEVGYTGYACSNCDAGYGHIGRTCVRCPPAPIACMVLMACAFLQAALLGAYVLGVVLLWFEQCVQCAADAGPRTPAMSPRCQTVVRALGSLWLLGALLDALILIPTQWDTTSRAFFYATQLFRMDWALWECTIASGISRGTHVWLVQSATWAVGLTAVLVADAWYMRTAATRARQAGGHSIRELGARRYVAYVVCLATLQLRGSTVVRAASMLRIFPSYMTPAIGGDLRLQTYPDAVISVGEYVGGVLIAALALLGYCLLLVCLLARVIPPADVMARFKSKVPVSGGDQCGGNHHDKNLAASPAASPALRSPEAGAPVAVWLRKSSRGSAKPRAPQGGLQELPSLVATTILGEAMQAQVFANEDRCATIHGNLSHRAGTAGWAAGVWGTAAGRVLVMLGPVCITALNPINFDIYFHLMRAWMLCSCLAAWFARDNRLASVVWLVWVLVQGQGCGQPQHARFVPAAEYAQELPALQAVWYSCLWLALVAMLSLVVYRTWRA